MLGHLAGATQFRAAEITGDVENKGQPVNPDTQIPGQLPGGLDGEIGVGALEIDKYS